MGETIQTGLELEIWWGSRFDLGGEPDLYPRDFYIVDEDGRQIPPAIPSHLGGGRRPILITDDDSQRNWTRRQPIDASVVPAGSQVRVYGYMIYGGAFQSRDVEEPEVYRDVLRVLQADIPKEAFNRERFRGFRHDLEHVLVVERMDLLPQPNERGEPTVATGAMPPIDDKLTIFDAHRDVPRRRR